MIIRANKTYEQNSIFPNSNFYPDEQNYVVEDKSELANKIISLYPYYDFVLDDNGNLVDVTPLPVPPPEPQPPTVEERLKSTEDAIVQLMLGGTI